MEQRVGWSLLLVGLKVLRAPGVTAVPGGGPGGGEAAGGGMGRGAGEMLRRTGGLAAISSEIFLQLRL